MKPPMTIPVICPICGTVIDLPVTTRHLNMTGNMTLRVESGPMREHVATHTTGEDAS